MIKVLVALQVPGVDVHEVMQVHRRHVDRDRCSATPGSRPRPAEDDVALALVVDAELFRLEAVVRWLDAADVRLKQLPSPTPAEVADLPLEPTRTMEVSR